MYNIIYETSCQSRFDAQYRMLGAGALGRPRGMVWGGRREEGSGWGTRVYLWWIHFDIWQNQYNIVKLKNKIKLKKYVLKKCALFGVSVFNLCICFHDTNHIVSYLLLSSSVLTPSTKKDVATHASILAWKIL